jgi:cytochrome c
MKNLFHATVVGLCLMACGAGVLAAEKSTAEEAVAMVKQAVAYLNANGKEKAFEEFNDPQGQFVTRDLYVFVNDMNGTTVAHGGNVKLVGKNVLELKDASGKAFIREMVEVTRTRGKGWVEYKWMNPQSRSLETKLTYVEKAGDFVIGCGIYK